MYRLTQEDLADCDHLMAIKFKPVPKIELPKIVKDLAYLDLASAPVFTASKSKESANADHLLPILVSAGVDLSTGPDLSTGNYIVVPTGAVKLLNRSILKRQGNTGEFLLFPNLPIEVRGQILAMDLPLRLLPAVEFLKSDMKTTGIRVVGGSYPTVALVSKSCRNDLIEMGMYKKCFSIEAGGKTIPFNAMLDTLVLDSDCHRHWDVAKRTIIPKLTLKNVLHNAKDLELVRSVSVEFFTFVGYLDWAKKNIAALSSLKLLHLYTTLAGAHDSAVFEEMMVFKKSSDADSYSAEFTKGATTTYGFDACDEFFSKLDNDHAIMGEKFLESLECPCMPNRIQMVFRYIPGSPPSPSPTGPRPDADMVALGW